MLKNTDLLNITLVEGLKMTRSWHNKIPNLFSSIHLLQNKRHEHLGSLRSHVLLLKEREKRSAKELEQLQVELAQLRKICESIEVQIDDLRKRHNVKMDIIKHLELHESLL